MARLRLPGERPTIPAGLLARVEQDLRARGVRTESKRIRGRIPGEPDRVELELHGSGGNTGAAAALMILQVYAPNAVIEGGGVRTDNSYRILLWLNASDAEVARRSRHG